MPTGLVLVIEDDEWVSRLLSDAIRDAGYDSVVCDTAKVGLETASAVGPDCIVCDVDLPDHDGYWVARGVRAQTSRVASTPFVFLSSRTDQRSRLEGFHVGADVYMTKPFRVDEVVAQVAALVQMAARLRQRRASLLSIPAPSGPDGVAIEGDLAQMSIATVLTLLEMERRSGTFEVISKKRRAQLEIASGFIVQGSLEGSTVSALAALRALLGWKVGRFTFTPGPAQDAPTNNKTIGAFLIEAVRLDDEHGRAELGDGARPRRGGGGKARPPEKPPELDPEADWSGVASDRPAPASSSESIELIEPEPSSQDITVPPPGDGAAATVAGPPPRSPAGPAPPAPRAPPPPPPPVAKPRG